MGSAPQIRALAVSLLLAPILSTGQQALALPVDGLSASRTTPVIDAIGPLESPNSPNTGSYSAAVFYDFASNPMTTTQKSGGESLELVSETQRTIAVLQYGVSSRLSLEASVPYCFQPETNRLKNSFSTANTQESTPGDATISSRIRILSNSALSFAILPFALLPTGNPENLTGDGVAAYGSNFSIGGQLHRWLWAANAGFIYRPVEATLTDDRLVSVHLGSQYTGGLGTGYRIGEAFTVEAGVLIAQPDNQGIEYDMMHFGEASLKIRRTFQSGISAETGASAGIGYGVGVPEFRITAGIIWRPSTGSQQMSSAPKRRVSAPLKNWYEARPQDLAADRDIRKDANKMKNYDNDGEKHKSFGFYTP